MKPEINTETAETVQTGGDQAVVQERLVQLLPCPFCGSAAEITDKSLPNRPKSWFFAWCENRPECNCWRAAGSPEKVAKIWNRRAGREAQCVDVLKRVWLKLNCGIDNEPDSAIAESAWDEICNLIGVDEAIAWSETEVPDED